MKQIENISKQYDTKYQDILEKNNEFSKELIKIIEENNNIEKELNDLK